MECSKHSKNEEALYKLVTSNDEYKRIDRKTIQVIKNHIKIDLEINEDEEEFDMVIEDMNATSRRAGIKEGISKDKWDYY